MLPGRSGGYWRGGGGTGRISSYLPRTLWGLCLRYCYARPTHEYLGFSAGLDFESKILVKEDAPELLRRELSSPRWQPQTVVFSGVTDSYQPVERRLQLTRRCLEVFVEFRN